MAGGVGHARDGARPLPARREHRRRRHRGGPPGRERGAAGLRGRPEQPPRAGLRAHRARWAAVPCCRRARARAPWSTRPCRTRCGARWATARRWAARARRSTTASTTRRGSRSTRSPTRTAAATCGWPTTATTAWSSTCPTAPTSARSDPSAPARASSSSPTTSGSMRAPRASSTCSTTTTTACRPSTSTAWRSRASGRVRPAARRVRVPAGARGAGRRPDRRRRRRRTTRTTASRPSAPTAPCRPCGGSPGAVPATSRARAGVAIDAAGTIHVADTLADRLQRLAPDGAYAGQRATSPTARATRRRAPARASSTCRPRPLRPGRQASGWPTRATTASSGSPGRELGRDPTRGLSGPRAVAGEPRPAGTILVADTGNDRVRRLDRPAGGRPSRWAARRSRGRSASRRRRTARSTSPTRARPDRRARRRRSRDAAARPAAPRRSRGRRGSSSRASRCRRRHRQQPGPAAGDAAPAPGTHRRRRQASSGRFVAPTGVAVSPTARRSSSPTAAPPHPALHAHRRARRPGGDADRRRARRRRARRGDERPAGHRLPARLPPGLQRRRDRDADRRAPAAGSAFAGWSGACAGKGPCRLAVGASPSAVTATFDVAGPTPPGGDAPPPVVAPPALPRLAPRRPPPHPRGLLTAPLPVVSAARLTPVAFRATRSGGSLLPPAPGPAARCATRFCEVAELTLTVERVAWRSRLAAVSGSIRLPSTAGTHRLRLSGPGARDGRCAQPATASFSRAGRGGQPVRGEAGRLPRVKR